MIFNFPPPPDNEYLYESLATIGEMRPDARNVWKYMPQSQASETGETVELKSSTETGGTLDLKSAYSWVRESLEKVAFLSSLDSKWHEEGAEAPDLNAVSSTNQVLLQLSEIGLKPADIDASIDGGICISFVGTDRRANIECFNSDEILGAMVVRGQEPTVWEINPNNLRESTARILGFLNG